MKKLFPMLIAAFALMSCGENLEPVVGELGIHDLRGPVKSAVVNYDGEYEIEYTFDENGMWLTQGEQTIEEVYNNGIERDEQGRIVNGKFEEPESCNLYAASYVYNGDGSIATIGYEDPEETSSTSYAYGENGDCVESHMTGTYCEMGAEEEEVIDVITEYEVLEKDARGNWTKRVEKTFGKEKTVTRQITYFE